MARLTIQQTAAPDFSATGQILANAGKAFTTGMNSAKDLLGTYQAGVQTAADNSIMPLLNQVKNEKDLNALLSSGALNNKDLSVGMRQRISGLRTKALGYTKNRADIGLTRANASNMLASAAATNSSSARQQTKFKQTQHEYKAGLALAPLYQNAMNEARKVGNSGTLDANGNHTGSTQATPGIDAFRVALAQSGLGTSAVKAYIGDIVSARTGGQATNVARRALYVKDLLNTAANSAASDPNTVLAVNYKNAMVKKINSLDITGTEKKNAIANLDKTAEQLKNSIAPGTVADPNVTNAVSTMNAVVKQQTLNDVMSTDMKLNSDFSKDPTAALIAHLRLGKDGQNPNTSVFGMFGENFDPNLIRNAIHKLALKKGVSDSIAAVAMANVFQRDPNGRNTVANRFPEAAASNYITSHLGLGAQRKYRSRLAARNNQQTSIDLTAYNIKLDRTRLAKATNPQVRDKLQRKINYERKVAKSGHTLSYVQRGLNSYVDRLVKKLPKGTTMSDKDLAKYIANDGSLDKVSQALFIANLGGK